MNFWQKITDIEIIKKNLVALNYRGKEYLYHTFPHTMPDPIFIIGCSRSGTTVTFETIRKAQELISFPYEIPQFWHSLVGPRDNDWASDEVTADNASPEHREKAFAYFYARLGKGQVLDKTCINIFRIPYLFSLFPDAKFVFIQRDGRNNISSLIDGWEHNNHFSLKPFLGHIPADIQIENGKFNDWSFFLPPDWRSYNTSPLEEVCAHQWLTANQSALTAIDIIPKSQWIQIRYEDLFNDPVEMFKNTFEFLGLNFSGEIKNRCSKINKNPTSIVKGLPQKDKWKSHNAQRIEKILPKIEPMMKKLGYF